MDKLFETWKLETPGDIHLSTSETLESVRKESNRIKRAARMRDRLELAAGVLVITILIPLAIILPAPVSLGCLAMIASVVWVCGWLLAARKQRREIEGRTTNNLVEDLERDAALIRQQKRLLSQVSYWYLLPLAIGIGALVLSVEMTGPGIDPTFLVGYSLATAAVFLVVHWLNRHVAKTQLQPREAAIEQLIEDLQ